MKIVSQPSGYFVLDIPETIKSGEKAECKLKVNYMQLGHSFEKSITLEINDQVNSRFTIPVIRRLIGNQAKVGTDKTKTPEKKSPGGH